MVDHCAGKVISNIFTRVKRDSGKHRMILNLQDLNKDIELVDFKMDTLGIVLQLLRPNSFCVSIDLADAYYSVNVDRRFRKYLRFQYEDCLYQFTCLPNGLSPEP